MKSTVNWGTGAPLLLLLGCLSGCASSMIGVHPGADRVSLAETGQVGGCQADGLTTVSVMSKVLFFNRNANDVEANLLQLARNDAADAGANTLVKGNSEKFGERTFALYKCQP